MIRKWVYWVLVGALMLGVHSAAAQEPPPPPGPEFGPAGPMMELLGFGGMHPGKVVTNAPYSGVAVREITQKLADGNSIDRTVQVNVYRDSQGRTRRDSTFNGFGPLASSGETRTVTMIHDPVAGTSYILHPDTKTAEQLPAPPARGNDTANPQSKFQARIQQEIADGTLKKEDLGTQTINGISTQGTRYTRVIPAGQVGNSKPITVTNEQWYSPDLQIVVKSTRTDPRMGQTTYTLTDIQRTEPAAALFTVPSGYSVTQAKAHHHGKGGPGGAPVTGEVPPPPGE